MTTDPVTETIYVTYDGGTSFSFEDSHHNDIPNGDLSAYPGANKFTFQAASGQTWKFFSARLSATASSNFHASMGLDDDFRIRITSLQNPATQILVEDTNRETSQQVYEYSFQIQLADGRLVDCDPKIYNKIG